MTWRTVRDAALIAAAVAAVVFVVATVAHFN